MTVRRLIADLAAIGVRVVVDEMGLEWIADADDPPDQLLDALAVLHTGVRAVLSGRRWFGFDATTGRPCGPRPKDGAGLLAFGALDPNAKLPPNVSFLCCEGDTGWDRIDADARRLLPFLFATATERNR